MGAGIWLYRIDPLLGIRLTSGPCYRDMRHPGCVLAQAAYTQRWPNLSPNGREAKGMGGTHAGGMKCDIALVPGGHWKLGSFQWPLGSGNADPARGKPTTPGFE